MSVCILKKTLGPNEDSAEHKGSSGWHFSMGNNDEVYVRRPGEVGIDFWVNLRGTRRATQAPPPQATDPPLP